MPLGIKKYSAILLHPAGRLYEPSTTPLSAPVESFLRGVRSHVPQFLWRVRRTNPGSGRQGGFWSRSALAGSLLSALFGRGENLCRLNLVFCALRAWLAYSPGS
jgi:hypothetical protein